MYTTNIYIQYESYFHTYYILYIYISPISQIMCYDIHFTHITPMNSNSIN